MDGTSNKYPLYSASLEGSAWDNDKRYEMIVITKWSDKTYKAKEVGRKVFYIDLDKNIVFLNLILEDENVLIETYEKHKQYSHLYFTYCANISEK